MSQNTHESLSALMDGESDELELRRVLKALASDSDSADTWRRYHLARSLMQRDRDIDVSVDLSAGVMARLQDEPVPLGNDASLTDVASTDVASKSRKSSFSLARGAGIAATVSLMVITGVQYFNSGSDTLEQSDSVASSAPSSVSATQQVQPVNLSSLSTPNAVVSDVPVFEQTPFRVNGQVSNSGFMTVGQNGMTMPNVQPASTMNIQSFAMDSEQLRLLQSYFEEHGQSLEQTETSDTWSATSSSAAQ
ncbi:sigma-E factor negative regulatory protein [Halomonas sp. LS-001]